MTKIEEGRNDLHLTSTGRGHEHRGKLVFPPVDFKRSVQNPLPTPLGKDDNICDFYITTTGSAHNYKPTNMSLETDIYKKAPGHWGVKYVEDNIKKLQVKPQRQALTMGNQSSEMKAQFQGKEGIPMSTAFSSGLQPPMYNHHHSKGPLKSLVPSTQNPEMAGLKYNIHDRGVFNYHGDMYLTTTQKDHRFFNRVEKNKYPRKEYGTYWECEGYPKAWGHGSKHNPLPLDSIPREKGPMRDHTWFKSATTIPRIPKQLQPVPNTGMRSEVSANFKNITEQKRKELFHCPVPTPWNLKGAGPEEIFSIPRMYKTEYQSISSGRPVIV